MISKRKPVSDDTATLEKQRYIFSIALIAVLTMALSILMYVAVNLYLVVKVGQAPDADIGKSLMSGFLETFKIVVGLN